MNYRLVSQYLGVMLLLLAGAMGVCLGISYVLPSGTGFSDDRSLQGWGISVVITSLCGGAMVWMGRRRPAKSDLVLLRKDAAGTVGLGWVLCCLFGSLPYLFCEPRFRLSEALFESVSGLTTTGATMITDIPALPHTILLWRSLTQWMGGMGILAMFVLLSASLGAGGKSLFRTESSMHTNEVLGVTMRKGARWLWQLYVSLTLICGLGLWALGMTPFQAVNHGMTTVATGGFSTENTSITSFGIGIQLWMMVFMFIGGFSFPLIVTLIRKRQWPLLKRHEESWVFVGIVMVTFSVILAIRLAGSSWGPNWLEETVGTGFNVISLATSAGFSVGDYDLWPPLSKGLLLFLMLIGGCAGSTTGGLKVSRLILWLKMMRTEIRKPFRPHLVIYHKLNGRVVPPGAAGHLLVVLTSAVAISALGSFILIALEPDKSIDGSVSAVLACVSNVGPAFHEFGPTDHYGALSPPSMVLLSFLMILGRLEYVALLVLLSRQLWRPY